MGLKDFIVDLYIKRQLHKKENLSMVTKIISAWKFLEGNKSTFFAILSGLAILGNILGFLDNNQTEAILALSGTAYAGSMASKINRLIGVVKEAKQVVTAVETTKDGSTTTTVAVGAVNPPEAK
jgi:hypothetical protein